MKQLITLILLFFSFQLFANDSIFTIQSIDKGQKISFRALIDGTQSDDKNDDVSFDFSYDFCYPYITGGINTVSMNKINDYMKDVYYKKTEFNAYDLLQPKIDKPEKQLADTLATQADSTDSTDSTDENENDYHYFEHSQADFDIASFNRHFLCYAFNWMHESKGGSYANYSQIESFDTNTGDRIRLGDVIDTTKYDLLKKLIADKFSKYPQNKNLNNLHAYDFDTIPFDQSPKIGMNSIGFYVSKSRVQDWLEDYDNYFAVYLSYDEIKPFIKPEGVLSFVFEERPTTLSKNVKNRNVKKIPSFFFIPIYIPNIDEAFSKTLVENKVKEISSNYNYGMGIVQDSGLTKYRFSKTGELESINFNKDVLYSYIEDYEYWTRLFYNNDTTCQKQGVGLCNVNLVKKENAYTLDKQGNLLHDAFIDTYEKFYSNTDSTTLVEITNSGIYNYYIRQYYNTKNMIMREDFITASGNKEFYTAYTYNKAGQPELISAFNNAGDTLLIMQYKYDDKNRVIEYSKKEPFSDDHDAIFYNLGDYNFYQADTGGELLIFNYDSKGRISYMSKYDFDFTKFYYDEYNNLNQIEMYHNYGSFSADKNNTPSIFKTYNYTCY